ncbi:MAG TPA: hypothetical protein VLC47_08730 [Burkholderiales bacterium]|nr:hypothetical protein [Burkholderiales bacterium]
MHSKQVRDKSGDAALVDRLVALASARWVDPNERCACVTIALALLVCPENVSVEPSEFAAADDLEYRNVRLSLPRAAQPAQGPFDFFAWGAARPPLPNLRDSYDDFENNLEAQELLGYYTLCDGPAARAALLTLIWVCLVEGYREVRKSVNGAFVLASPRYGVELTLDRFRPNRLVQVRYAPPPRRPWPTPGARPR